MGAKACSPTIISHDVDCGAYLYAYYSQMSSRTKGDTKFSLFSSLRDYGVSRGGQKGSFMLICGLQHIVVNERVKDTNIVVEIEVEKNNGR